MAIKKHDFIQVEYTGKLKEEGTIFDTTDKKTAEENELSSKNSEFGPITVCVGKGHLLPGLDEYVEGKEPGSYEVELPVEKGFGKKDAKRIQLVPTAKFKKQGINPTPGLQINIDGNIGTIKTVTGGRTIVDFNHPLAGRELTYSLKIIGIVDDKAEQVKAHLKMMLGLTPDVTVNEGTARITFPQELPKELLDPLKKEILEVIDLESIEFDSDKKEKIKNAED